MIQIELPMNTIVILLTSVLRMLLKYPHTQTRSEQFLNNKTKDSLCLYPTDPYEVMDIIKSMKSKKSAGHDGITSEHIKIISDDVSIPISVIIKTALSKKEQYSK